ncbi:hypothetical protein NPIL_112171 [Nephila pilipes]|uniref:Uncharacterized protein n=1 Tax=Nephila pilipes TaxID=299642 RepID=A0A8X6NPE5_NEPPI|nr:hypothetical protein NPIL_117141 [Nephila pilipes]GFT83078.1 hypothetical protein NPIL_112171 [Nephila pilipes]
MNVTATHVEMEALAWIPIMDLYATVLRIGKFQPRTSLADPTVTICDRSPRASWTKKCSLPLLWGKSVTRERKINAYVGLVRIFPVSRGKGYLSRSIPVYMCIELC